MANLYETIEMLCAERNIRPGRLCDDLGLSRGLMTDLKMGRKKSVTADTAQKIASYFGVSVGYLLGQPENESSDILDQVDIAFYGDFKELDEAAVIAFCKADSKAEPTVACEVKENTVQATFENLAVSCVMKPSVKGTKHAEITLYRNGEEYKPAF
jgi:transcriptional regulator with XRE-family HTH domain